MRQLCPFLKLNVCCETIPFLGGSGEDGLLSVAGGTARSLEGVGCCVT